MNDLKQMLFSLQRFQVLALYSNTAIERTVSGSYAYAWWQSVYPALNETAPWHKPYADSFAVSARQISELREFLQQRWSQNEPITFYELEDHYGIRGSNRPGPAWSQQKLIHACRYLFLHQQQDAAFWTTILSGSQCPKEAEVISQPFGVGDFQFE